MPPDWILTPVYLPLGDDRPVRAQGHGMANRRNDSSDQGNRDAVDEQASISLRRQPHIEFGERANPDNGIRLSDYAGSTEMLWLGAEGIQHGMLARVEEPSF
jgi:hypothetical protein